MRGGLLADDVLALTAVVAPALAGLFDVLMFTTLVLVGSTAAALTVEALSRG